MSRTVPNPKRSASYYRKNAKARAKKAAYDKAFNARPEQKKDRAAHGRASYFSRNRLSSDGGATFKTPARPIAGPAVPPVAAALRVAELSFRSRPGNAFCFVLFAPMGSATQLRNFSAALSCGYKFSKVKEAITLNGVVAHLKRELNDLARAKQKKTKTVSRRGDMAKGQLEKAKSDLALLSVHQSAQPAMPDSSPSRRRPQLARDFLQREEIDWLSTFWEARLGPTTA